MRVVRGGVIAVLAAASMAAATTGEPHTHADASVTPPASMVHVTIDRIVDDVERVEVTAGTSGPHADSVVSSSWLCVERTSSAIRTESRPEGEVKVRVDMSQEGCAEDVSYAFDPLSWEATVSGTVPITVTTSRYEQRPGGWQLVETTRAKDTVAIDASWHGTGDERVDGLPGICYTSPPSVCPLPPSPTVWRDASLTGDVTFGSLNVPLTGETGLMAFRVGL